MSLFGELLGFHSAEKSEDAAHARFEASQKSIAEQQARNAELQREFAQHGIRWRVEDAKAAGLHPLYAIGGSGAAYAPNAVVVGSGGSDGGAAKAAALSRMGQGVERAIFGTMTNEQRQIHHAQLKVMESEARKNDALALAAASEAARARQADGSSTPLPIGSWDPGGEHGEVFSLSSPLVMGRELTHDAFRITRTDAPSVMSGNPNVQAGPAGGTPGLMEVRIGQGFSMLLPRSQDLGESLEALVNPLTWGPIYNANVEKYGPGWAREFWRQMPIVGRAIGVGEGLGQWVADAREKLDAMRDNRPPRGARDPQFAVGTIRRNVDTPWPHATDVYSKYR